MKRQTIYQWMDDHPVLGCFLSLFVLVLAGALKAGTVIRGILKGLVELFGGKNWP